MGTGIFLSCSVKTLPAMMRNCLGIFCHDLETRVWDCKFIELLKTERYFAHLPKFLQSSSDVKTK